MKRNHSLLEYTRDNDTQVSELGPSGPSCCSQKAIENLEINTHSNMVLENFISLID